MIYTGCVVFCLCLCLVSSSSFSLSSLFCIIRKTNHTIIPQLLAHDVLFTPAMPVIQVQHQYRTRVRRWVDDARLWIDWRSLFLAPSAFLSGPFVVASSRRHQQTLDVTSLTSLIARQYLAPRLPPSLAVEHLCSRLPVLARRSRTRIEAILKHSSPLKIRVFGGEVNTTRRTSKDTTATIGCRSSVNDDRIVWGYRRCSR